MLIGTINYFLLTYLLAYMTELGKLRASNWWVTVSTGGENFNLLENLLQKVTLWGVWLIMLFDEYSANSTWLVTSRHVRRVESMRFGCVELVKQHGLTRSTRSSRLARQSGMCRVVSRRAKWNLGPSVLSAMTDCKNIVPNYMSVGRVKRLDCNKCCDVQTWSRRTFSWILVAR